MNILFSFTAFVLGLLLIIIILYNNRKITAKLLAFFIFTIAYNNLLNFLWISHYTSAVSLLYTGPLVAYLRTPCLFFYVLFLLDEKRVLQWKDAWHLLPAAIYFISFSPLLFNYPNYNKGLLEFMYPNNRQALLFVEGWVLLPRRHIILKSIATVLYIVLLLGLWKKYRPYIAEKVANNKQVLNWVKLIMAIFITNGVLGVLISLYPSATGSPGRTILQRVQFCRYFLSRWRQTG